MKKQGFSLMEMMIVLLITAIIAAATAPMVSKKMMRDAGAGNSPWLYAGLNGSIVYNPDGNTNKTAMIGAVDASKANNAKFYIESSSTEPQMAIGSSGGANVVGISSINTSVAISNNSISSTGTVAVGYDANAKSTDAVAIGRMAEGRETSTVAIGGLATAEGQSGIAIGRKAYAKGSYSFAVGDASTDSNS